MNKNKNKNRGFILVFLLYFALVIVSFAIYLISLVIPVQTTFGQASTPEFTYTKVNDVQNPIIEYYVDSDDTLIQDQIIVENLDPTRNMSAIFTGTIGPEEKQGWFYFSQNPVSLAPLEKKLINYVVYIPANVCSDTYTGKMRMRLWDYDGFDPTAGVVVELEVAKKVEIEVDSGITCVPGDPIPGLDTDIPVSVKNLIFLILGKHPDDPIPTTTIGGVSIQAFLTETICNDSIDNDFDGTIDCADPDCATSPFCYEYICNDGLDNDNDTLIDCSDPDCTGSPYCGGGGGDPPPPPESICDNDQDDDLDGPVDCHDIDCKQDPACQEENFCDDGEDNDIDYLYDCNDPDCENDPVCIAAPSIETICDDGIDNDVDAYTDCDDSDCIDDPACAPPPPGVESICDDGIDNDSDGPIDCADTDCTDDPYCLALPSEAICDDGIDNDSDGLIDCADNDCDLDPVCEVIPPESICDDTIDNDSDGDIDCDDTDCINDPFCAPVIPGVETICNDGIDNDSDGPIDCADTDCEGNPACIAAPATETICNDGVDNDLDGPIDCADSDCVNNPICISPTTELICDDTIDNDNDGTIDCSDSDCIDDPVCILPAYLNIKGYPEKRVPTINNWGTRGMLLLYPADELEPRYIISAEIDDYGLIALENVIDSGFYHISFKGLSHLVKFIRNIYLEEGETINLDFTFDETFYMLAGDVQLDKDNYVNILDVVATIDVLYEQNEHADLNKDGIVNTLDLAIEFYNLYVWGEKRIEIE